MTDTTKPDPVRLKTQNNQEAFDAALMGVLEQGTRSLTKDIKVANTPLCSYGGDPGDPSVACGVGHCIEASQRYMLENYEQYGATDSGINELYEKDAVIINDCDVEFLNAMQEVHDNVNGFDNNPVRFRIEFIDSMKTLALDWDLTCTVPEKFKEYDSQT